MKQTDKLRWGIVSTGRIAHTMSTALEQAPSSELWAVSSRSLESAQAFAEKFGISHARRDTCRQVVIP